MNIDELLPRLLGEFSASAMYLCLGCMGCVPPIDDNILMVSLNFGFSITAATQCFACVSGAHINPCVSVAAAILQRITILDMALYICAQFLGAFFGYGLTMLLSPPIPELCVSTPHSAVTDVQALIFEYILTASWVFTMCGIWDQRNERFNESRPIRIGFAVATLTLCGCYFTGASMNPAATLAPAVFQNKFRKIWIYFVAQPIAAVTIPTAWRYLFAVSSVIVEIVEEEPEP